MHTKRHAGRPKSEGPWAPCKAEGCRETIAGGSKGFCHRHYIYARRGIFDWETGRQIREFQRVSSYGPGHLCSVTGCGRKARASGMCEAHYQRRNLNIPLDTPIKKKKLTRPIILCLVEGCQARANNRGMCLAHAERKRRGLLGEAGEKLREPYSMGHGRPRKNEKWHSGDGYVLVLAPIDHPNKRQDGSILEHRLVMEQHLGRYLEEWELVHHKDGNRSHNQIENLELMDGRAISSGPGHAPGHDFDARTAAQILLQREDISTQLRECLVQFMNQPRLTLVI
jgi:hypothetical protein